MSRFLAEVVVSLKPMVNDPQGQVVRDGLHHLGFSEVGEVRVGKHIAVEMDAESAGTAHARVTEMCETLLRNPVIEEVRVSVAALETV